MNKYRIGYFLANKMVLVPYEDTYQGFLCQDDAEQYAIKLAKEYRQIYYVLEIVSRATPSDEVFINEIF